MQISVGHQADIRVYYVTLHQSAESRISESRLRCWWRKRTPISTTIAMSANHAPTMTAVDAQSPLMLDANSTAAPSMVVNAAALVAILIPECDC
jgi:hypothetical protein